MITFYSCFYFLFINLVYVIIITSTCLYRLLRGCSLRRWKSAAAVKLRSWIPDLLRMKQPHWEILNTWTHCPLLGPSPLLQLCCSPMCRSKQTTVHSQSWCSRTNQPLNKLHTWQTKRIFTPWRRIYPKQNKPCSVKSVNLLRHRRSYVALYMVISPMILKYKVKEQAQNFYGISFISPFQECKYCK